MGLDTIALLVAFEKEFGIEVPNADAEQMATVGSVATWFYEHLPIPRPHHRTQALITQKVTEALSAIGLHPPFRPESSIAETFGTSHDLPSQWAAFGQAIDLSIPPLNRYDLHPELLKNRNMVQRIFYRERPPVGTHTLERLIEWIGALNYQALINPKQPASLFEVLMVVIGLTHEVSGAPLDEIHWNASFTTDLGMD